MVARVGVMGEWVNVVQCNGLINLKHNNITNVSVRVRSVRVGVGVGGGGRGARGEGWGEYSLP